MNDNLMAIAMTEAKEAAAQGETMVDKLKAAMAVTRTHWLLRDDDERFRSAVGGVMLHYGEGSEEWEKLTWEIGAIQKISVYIAALQAGLLVEPPSVSHDRFSPIGLLAMWRKEK